MSLECGRSSINLDPAFPAGLLAPRVRNTMLTSLARARAGTHDTLSQAGGLYAELFRLQARGLRLITGTGPVVDGARSERGRCALCALAEFARHLRGGDRDGGTFQDRRPGPAQQGGELKTPGNLPEIVSREKWLAARRRARDAPARRVRHLSGAAEAIGVCGGSEDLS